MTDRVSAGVSLPITRLPGTCAYLILTLCVTLALQQYIGLATVYHDDLAARQAESFERILSNDPPPGGRWSDLGMNGTNIRLGSIWILQAIQDSTGLSLQAAMRILDTVCLWALLSAVVPYLRFWFTRSASLLGLGYIVAVLPLTYFLFYFHPWDRLAAVTWVVSFWLIRRGSWKMLAALLPFFVLVKYDIAMVAGLYWLAWIRIDKVIPVTARSVVLVVAGMGMYIALLMLYPSNDAIRGGTDMLVRNVRMLLVEPTVHQPLLVYLPLLLPLWFGLRSADQFIKASVLFAACFTALALVSVNYIEMRAQMPILLALLPCALLGVELLTGESIVRERRSITST